jgi:hypothetical protein
VDVKHNHEGRVCDPHCPAWQKDNYHEERARQKDAVRAEERAAIVAWLRKTGRYDNPWNLSDVADAIEKGEHRKTPPT